MPTDRNFALRLMLAQEARGLTQTQLAEAIGSTKSVVCLLLQGKTHPSYETLVSLAKTLKVSGDYLLGLKGN
jgi:transcriptional regulator with XRE-family HTH domain